MIGMNKTSQELIDSTSEAEIMRSLQMRKLEQQEKAMENTYLHMARVHKEITSLKMRMQEIESFLNVSSAAQNLSRPF